MGRYAEVIGDPIAHSKSPLIHNFWLRKLGIEGEYRATRVHFNDLPDLLESRRRDPSWCGCNITIPHKRQVVDLLDGFTAGAVAAGAVNCVYRRAEGLWGTNTDIDGIEAVFDSRIWRANQVTLIGGGGAARAALEVLRRRDTMEVFMLVRNPESARSLHASFARSGSVHALHDPRVSFTSSDYVINATPLGMAGMPPMPDEVLDGLARVARHASVFDMVYSPPETELLSRAKSLSLDTVGGLDMLMEQARGAFRLFFGQPAPREYDPELRRLLTS
jgi:shikimate dehydrogenase